MNKLKNIDYKKVLIDHGEKLGLGIVSLIALFALVGTSWGTYKDTTPQEMTDKAKDTLQQMRDSKFTAEEAKKFLTVDEEGPNPNIRREAAQLHAAVDLARYEYSTDMTWPVIKKGDPIREIVYVKPRNVIVDAGRTLIPLNVRAANALEEDSDDSTELAAADTEMADEEDALEESEFDRRTGNRGSVGGFPGGGFPGGGLAGGGLSGGYSPGGAGMSSAGLGLGMGIGDEDDEETEDSDGGYLGGGGEGFPGMGMMGGAAAGGEKKAIPARGHHYAAVRAIFPLRDQQVNVASAMHMSPTDEKLKAIVYVTNLIVERKTAVKGQDPWSGEWEVIDIQSAQDVLDQADGIEPDVVTPQVTDPAITMPLPPRMVGYWIDGSHPELETYELSELDQELLRKRDELLLELGKQQEDPNAQGPAPKGGFTKSQVDINSVRDSVMGAGSSRDSFNNAMGEFMNTMAGDTGNGTELKNRLKKLDGKTASGHLLLIRFLDFTVDPGRNYKYRVRVELRNPLFNLPIEELENPELASRQTWQTDWSEPSKPVHVPFEYHYFVDDADTRFGRETVAEMDVFQWFKGAGSLINAVLKVAPGQFIGQSKKKTEVLNFAAESFKEEAVDFTTDDLLVDVTGSRRIGVDGHPYLKIPKQRGGYRLPAEVLVMNKFFEVYSMDGQSLMGARNAAHKQYQDMVKANEDLKASANPSRDADNPYGGFMGGDEDEEGGASGGMGMFGGGAGGMGGMAGGRASRSSRRRGRRRSPLGGSDED